MTTENPFSDEQDRDSEDAKDNSTVESEEIERQDSYSGRQSQMQHRSAEQLWLISYSDFMTIMMIFFLAMYGYSHLTVKDSGPRVEQFAAIASEIKARMNDQVRIVENVDKMTLELGEGVLFKSGRADLSPDAVRTLAGLGAMIREANGHVIVEGHTDDVPVVGGPFRSNWELSASRAFSVIQELRRAGVPAEKLAAWGFGENRPVLDNATPENRQRNRRIDIVILKEKTRGA